MRGKNCTVGDFPERDLMDEVPYPPCQPACLLQARVILSHLFDRCRLVWIVQDDEEDKENDGARGDDEDEI